jgi:hypothetical protein
MADVPNRTVTFVWFFDATAHPKRPIVSVLFSTPAFSPLAYAQADRRVCDATTSFFSRVTTLGCRRGSTWIRHRATVDGQPAACQC